MKKLITYLTAVVAIGFVLALAAPAASNSKTVWSSVTTTATTVTTTTAPTAPPVHHRKAIHCSKRQPAKNEIHCGHRAYHFDKSSERWIANHPSAPVLYHSLKYYRWHQKVDKRWIAEGEARLRIPMTNDWVTAVYLVQRSWPGTASFMLHCSAHEGGHGAFIMNRQGSPAGGWMQYFETTWASHYSSAIAYARLHHLTLPPPQAGRWTSPLGQAFAAGWGFHYNHSAWTGDPYCW